MALDGVAKWLECRPKHQRVESSIPSQGHICKLQVQFPALMSLAPLPTPPSVPPSLPLFLIEINGEK